MLRERRARVRILTDPSEHVTECTRPEDPGAIANVMIRPTNMHREPNDTKFDNLRACRRNVCRDHRGSLTPNRAYPNKYPNTKGWPTSRAAHYTLSSNALASQIT